MSLNFFKSNLSLQFSYFPLQNNLPSTHVFFASYGLRNLVFDLNSFKIESDSLGIWISMYSLSWILNDLSAFVSLASL